MRVFDSGLSLNTNLFSVSLNTTPPLAICSCTSCAVVATARHRRRRRRCPLTERRAKLKAEQAATGAPVDDSHEDDETEEST